MGYDVEYLPVNSAGQIVEESFVKALTEETVLVSIMLANNETGTIEPIAAMAKTAHQHNVLFHTDAGSIC